MKRRLTIALALTALAVLAMASVAQAATTPSVTLTGTLTGNTYTMACTVNPLASSHTMTLYSQVRVTDASGAQVGNILPWFNEGTFKLRTVYGNRGYLQIVSSLIICFQCCRPTTSASPGSQATALAPPASTARRRSSNARASTHQGNPGRPCAAPFACYWGKMDP